MSHAVMGGKLEKLRYDENQVIGKNVLQNYSKACSSVF